MPSVVSRVGAQALTPDTSEVFLSTDPEHLTWTLGNSLVHVRFRLTQAGTFTLDEIRNARTGRAFQLAGDADSAVTVNGATIVPGTAGWRLADVATVSTRTGIQIGRAHV